MTDSNNEENEITKPSEGQLLQENDDTCQDNPSAPVIENNNNQKEEITVNPENEIYAPITQSDMPNINNNEINNNLKQKKKRKRKSKKREVNYQHYQNYEETINLPNLGKILAYILFSVPIIDFLMQIIFSYINLFLILDDIALLGISSLYLHHLYKHKNLKKCYIAALTIIIWFFGAAIKGIGMSNEFDKFEGPEMAIPITCLALIFIRVVILFCYIIITFP